MNYAELSKNILKEQSGKNMIQESDTWLDLGLDSLDIVESVMLAEENLKIIIPDSIVEKYSQLDVTAFGQLLQIIVESVNILMLF